MDRLRSLSELLENGFITQVEYDERRQQIVDEITGTSISTTSSVLPRRRKKPLLPPVLSRPPPEDWSEIPQENAVKFTFCPEKRKWSKTPVKVQLDPSPFARGGLRLVYHLRMVDDPGVPYVAKMSMDPRDNQRREIYFLDVEMQAHAKVYARKFNAYDPPKKVDFVSAFNLELLQREGKPVCGVERYIEGDYRKHNNNHGYVSEEERATPQAFSHFTFEASGRQLLICDVQGVSDLYTDPQIHSRDGRGFGKGNLGERGFRRFLATHRCNAICRYLRLPIIGGGVVDVGTMPLTRFMPRKDGVSIAQHDFTPVAQPLAPLTELSNDRFLPETACDKRDDERPDMHLLGHDPPDPTARCPYCCLIL